jgi:endonuclease/exonuclease/phosphatase family metal-dependent hydrolase
MRTAGLLLFALFAVLTGTAPWCLGLLGPLHARVQIATLLLGVTSGSVAIAFAVLSSNEQTPWRWTIGVAGILALLSPLVFIGTVLHASEAPIVVASRSATHAAERVDRLRVVVFNVLHGYPAFLDMQARRERLAQALERLDPDVILLQEAWVTRRWGDLAPWLGRRLDRNVAYARANGSYRLIGFEEGSAVLSRLPILTAWRLRLSPAARPWEMRIALCAALETAPGEQSTVVTAHLARDSTAVTAGQALDLSRRLPAHDLLLLAGDLNAPSGSDTLRNLTDWGLQDLLEGGIDHVLVPRSAERWRVETAAWTLRPEELKQLIGDPAPISDHPGIVVDFVRTVSD